MIRPVLGVELGANASYIASSLLNSLATNRALYSVLSVVSVPTCFRSLLPESNMQVHSFVHSKLCKSVKHFQLNLLPFSALSTRGSCNSPASSLSTKYSAGSSSSVPHMAIQDTVILRTSICGSSPCGCFACEGTSSVMDSAGRLVGVDDLK